MSAPPERISIPQTARRLQARPRMHRAAWIVGATLLWGLAMTPPTWAATRIKTIEWPLLQSLGTFTSEPQLSPPVTVPLPENGITVRTAYVEIAFAVASSTLGAGSFIGFRRGSGAGTAVNGDGSSFGALVQTTGETLRYLLRHNAMAAFTGPDACLAPNPPCRLFISLTGGTKANLSAKLVLTYEYDDASPTQVKTIRYFVGKRTITLPASTTQSFSHKVFVPEAAPVILASWYEIRGLVSGGKANLQGLFSLTGWSLPPAVLTLGADSTATDWLFLYQPPIGINPAPWPGPITPSTLLVSAIGTETSALSAEYAMTYQYDFTTSDPLQQTVRRPFGEISSVTLTAEDVAAAAARTITIDLPEAGAVRSAYAVIRPTASGIKSSLLLSVQEGACSNTGGVSYTIGDSGSAASPTASAPVILYPFVDPLIGLRNGWPDTTSDPPAPTTVTICPRWLSAGGGSRTMELVYTYEYTPPSAGTWPARLVQTVRYGAGIGEAIQDMAATAGPSTFLTAVFIPERLVSLRDVTVDAWDVSAATTDADLTLSVNSTGLDSLLLDNDGTAQLSGRLRCVTGSVGPTGSVSTSSQCPAGALISDAGSFTIQVAPQSSPSHLATAVTYATYLVSTSDLTSWTSSLGLDRGTGFGAPTLGSVVFAADAAGSLYALSSTTGVLVSITAAGAVVRGQSVLAGCCVYAATAGGSVFGLNAATGSLLWSAAITAEPDGVYARPAVLLSVSASASGGGGDSWVIAVTRSPAGLGSVITLKTSDGSLVSRFGGAAQGSPAACTTMGLMGAGNSPVLESGTSRFYVTSDTRGAGGCSVWAFRTDPPPQADQAGGTPALDWARAGLGSVGAAAVGHALNSLISTQVMVGAGPFGSLPATLYALSSVDGATLYSLSTGCRTGADGLACRFVAGLAVLPGPGLVSLFFTTSDDRLWHVRADGTRFTALWSLTSTNLGDATGFTAPIAAAGRVYVGDGQGRLHRITIATGQEAAGWPKRLITVDGYGRPAALSDPMYDLVGRRLFIGTNEGKVYAIYDP